MDDPRVMQWLPVALDALLALVALMVAGVLVRQQPAGSLLALVMGGSRLYYAVVDGFPLAGMSAFFTEPIRDPSAQVIVRLLLLAAFLWGGWLGWRQVAEVPGALVGLSGQPRQESLAQVQQRVADVARWGLGRHARRLLNVPPKDRH